MAAIPPIALMPDQQETAKSRGADAAPRDQMPDKN
jgi:hypothetical protein